MKENQSKNPEKLKDEEGKDLYINDEGLVDKKTLKKYKVHWYQKIPYPVRALFIKYWFFGLNYYLFEVGLGSIPYFREGTQSMTSLASFILMLISGFALGVFNDIFVYNILDVIEDYPHQKDPFVFFKSKKVYSLFINIAFGLVVGFLGIYLSGLLNLAIDPEGSSFWFREPFSCGLMMFLVDGGLIGIKDFLVLAYRHFFKKDQANEIQ